MERTGVQNFMSLPTRPSSLWLPAGTHSDALGQVPLFPLFLIWNLTC